MRNLGKQSHQSPSQLGESHFFALFFQTTENCGGTKTNSMSVCAKRQYALRYLSFITIIFFPQGGFHRSQCSSRFIQYSIHKAMTIHSAKKLGQFNSLVKHDAIRNIDAKT